MFRNFLKNARVVLLVVGVFVSLFFVARPTDGVRIFSSGQ